MRTRQVALVTAGILGATGVLAGSFVAHGLDAMLATAELDTELVSKRLDQAEVGVRYHLLHSVALLAIGLGCAHLPKRRTQAVIALLILGILLFSGSLYLLVLLNLPIMGAVTPIGGGAFIAAWVLIITLAFGTRSDAT